MLYAVSANPKHCKVFLLVTSALVCLALSAPVMAEDFVITSGTTTNDGNTIDGNDTVTVTGALVTTGSNEGIDTTGGTNTVSVSETGAIETAGGLANGIQNIGDSNETTVSGSIKTAGATAYGIVSVGNTNETTVSGSITTTGRDGYGIYNRGASNKTTVSGSIRTTGRDGYGIYNFGDSNETTVSGSITTTGLNVHGIAIAGSSNENTVSETGSITTTGRASHGIVSVGNTNETTVSGSIKTTGNAAVGIWDAGDRNKTTVSGSITTTGDEGYGIVSEGDSNEITVSETGSITTTGDDGHGILNSGDSNKTTVSGSITTAGREGHGIANAGDSNEITVSGSITTTGQSGYGIASDGDSNETTVSGTVKATGTKSAAFHNLSGSGNSFTLNEGATIIGDILADDSATNSKLIFNLGASTSYAYSISGKGAGTGVGQWEFSDLDGRTQGVTTTGTGCDTTILLAGNDVCNLVTAVGSGNAIYHNELTYDTNSSMIDSLEPHESNTWVNMYGGSSEQDYKYETSGTGISIGTPFALKSAYYMDLVFNMSNTNLDIGKSKHHQITAKSYNVGVVLRDLVPAADWSVEAFGFVGRNSYDGKRKVMNNDTAIGSETVTASYSGTEVLVGLDAQYRKSMDRNLTFTGGVNANLSNEKLKAYSESKYFAWDARTLMQTTGGISAGLEHKSGAMTTFASLGVERNSLQKGKTASYTNNGTAGSYTDPSTGDTFRKVSVGFDYVGSNNMHFTAVVEGFSSTGGISGNSAKLGFNWRF